MILVDANVLIYAYNEEGAEFEEAKAWVEETFSNPELVRLPWSVILAFLRITTDARIFTNPLRRDEATAIVERWLALPQVDALGPGPRHWAVLAPLIKRCRVSGKLMMDAHIAAMAIEHGGTLYSCDRDFARFDGLKWKDPLAYGEWVHESR